MPTGGGTGGASGGRMGFPGGPVQSAASKAKLRDLMNTPRMRLAGEDLSPAPQREAPNAMGLTHAAEEYRVPQSPMRDLRLVRNS